MYKDWVERSEDELDKELADGLITMKEYKRYIRELREEADEAGYYDGADQEDY